MILYIIFVLTANCLQVAAQLPTETSQIRFPICTDLECTPLPDNLRQDCRLRLLRISNTGDICYGCELNMCCQRTCPPLPPNTPAACIRKVNINGPDCPLCDSRIQNCQLPRCQGCDAFPVNFPSRCRVRGGSIGGTCRRCDQVNQSCFPEAAKRRLRLWSCPNLICPAVVISRDTPRACIRSGDVRVSEGRLCLGCSSVDTECVERIRNRIPRCWFLPCDRFPLDFPDRCKIRGDITFSVDGRRCRSCDSVDQKCFTETEKRRLNLRQCADTFCLGPPRNTPMECVRLGNVATSNGALCLDCPTVDGECVERHNIPRCPFPPCFEFPRIFDQKCKIKGNITQSDSTASQKCRLCDSIDQTCYPDSEKQRLKLLSCPHITCPSPPRSTPRECVRLGNVVAHSGSLCLGCATVDVECVDRVMKNLPRCSFPPCEEIPADFPDRCKIQGNVSTPLNGQMCRECDSIVQNCLTDIEKLLYELRACQAVTCPSIPPNTPRECIQDGDIIISNGSLCFGCSIVDPVCVSEWNKNLVSCSNEPCPAMNDVPPKCIVPGVISSQNGTQCRECPVLDMTCKELDVPTCAHSNCSPVPSFISPGCIFPGPVMEFNGEKCRGCPFIVDGCFT